MEWVTTSTMLADLRRTTQHGAWDVFISRFREPVIAFCRRLGLGEVAAEDVAQETFLAFVAAYRDDKFDRSKGRLSAWLFGIAYRQAMLELRRAGNRPVTIQPTPSDGSFWSGLPDESQATAAWDQEWERALLARCFEQARREFEPEIFRAFELVLIEQVSPAAAAERMNLPVKAVYNAKHRVLKRVRELRIELEEAEAGEAAAQTSEK